MKISRILFLTDNFPPESNAPANRTYEHCINWLKQGVEVTVVTCNPNFPKGKLYKGYKNKLYQTEVMDGIKVIRVWSFITQNRGTVKRILDYMSFALSSFLASLFIKTDVIIATSPQLFTAVGGYAVAKVKRKPWVMEVRDLWPESIQVLDAMKSNTVLNRLKKLVHFLYRKADLIVVVTDRFKQSIANEGIDSTKIHVVKNGVNRKRYFEIERNKDLIKKYQLEGKYIVGYIGTHGMAHGLDVILNAASKVEDESIQFLFIGHGALKTRLLKQKEELELKNVLMLDSVAREEVHQYVSIIDVALIPLRRLETFKTVIPSKIFENAAMAKPILLGVEGESKELIESYHAGLCFQPENEEDFLTKLTQLKLDKQLQERYKKGGLEMAKDFDRDRLATKMLKIIIEEVR